MKKFLLLIAVGMLTLVGCKDGSAYPLDESVWRVAIEITPTQKVDGAIFFYKTTFKIEMTTTINGQATTDRSEGTYIYNDPKISLIAKGLTRSGTIDNNKFTIDGYTFVRQ